MNYEYYNSLNHDNPNGLQIINDEINEKVLIIFNVKQI